MGANNPMYGKDRRELMNYARSFQGPVSDETRAKMSAAQLGRKHSDDTKAKMSKSAKEAKARPETIAKYEAYRKEHGGSAAKITPDDVREIRKIREETGESYAKIGKKFGLCSENISMICRRKIWKQVLD